MAQGGNGGIRGAKNTGTNGMWNTTDEFLVRQQGGNWTQLYAFSTFTFTTGGATGRYGPSLATLRSAYNVSWANTYLDMTTNGIQRWTVPATGTYRIDCYGAKGGDASYQTGGYGARAVATFSLNIGDVLQILVGQAGYSTTHSQDGNPVASGGGWSGVVNSSNSPLIIAGGGGGAARNSWTNANGIGGSATTSGTSYDGTSNNGAGSGGYGATGNTTGGPAAGFLGDGTAGSGSSDPARSFANGAIGGESARSWGGGNAYGGFGGGGGGGGLAAGGGGGYSGGAGGVWAGSQAGGGGGSYSSGTGSTITAAYNNDVGKVIITKL